MNGTPAREATSQIPATSKYPSPAAKQNCENDFSRDRTRRRNPSKANPAHTKSHAPAKPAATIRLFRKNEMVVKVAAARSTPSRGPRKSLRGEASPPVSKSAPSGATIHGPSKNSTSIIPR